MGDRKLKQIAEETIEITKQGYYYHNAEKIELVSQYGYDFNSVTVLDGVDLYEIIEDEDDFFEMSFYGSKYCRFKVLNSDSFKAARLLDHPLVLNFANARHPGGGFLNGARAQEESLCRCSTLYQSISSPKAAEMYEFNAETKSPLDSDYMLLSQNVCVFRDEDYNLLHNPYTVSVWTMPAPNLHGRARHVKQEEIDEMMKERLRKFFYAAARYGYRNLVLGAWGCGAFGHDAKSVAGYFRELFFEEEFWEFFDNVFFAVLGEGYNLNAFREAFPDTESDSIAEENDFKEMEYPMPICNHTLEVGKENIGYTQGITVDGIPFEAELTVSGHEKIVHVYFPEITEFAEFDGEDELSGNLEGQQSDNVIGFLREEEQTDFGVLAMGMAERDTEYSAKTLQTYIEYVITVGIVEFTGAYYNGAIQTFTDIEGHNVVDVIITLEDSNMSYAKCNLHFKPFEVCPGKPELKIIEFKKDEKDDSK